jgi:malate dehydrogenase (oxaloacetate-decarboxylating)(NADP+)
MWQLRQRKGLSLDEARRQLFNGNYFGSCMVARGDADALLSGVTMHYPETIRPALQVIGAHPSSKLVSGMYMLVTERHVVFCADTTVNINPTAEQVAQIAYAASRITRTMGIVPRIAMLSFSNFGSVKHPDAEKMARATQILKERDPTLIVDGEMQADTAFDAEILRRDYPFSSLKEQANVLIFPNLSAGNIAYKLLHHLGGATAIGPILVGMRRPVHVLERGADVQDIVNMAAVAVVDAQERTQSVEPAFAAASPAPTIFSKL